MEERRSYAVPSKVDNVPSTGRFRREQNFAILCPSLWNRVRKTTLSSGGKTFGQRGRTPMNFGVEDMIEHVPMDDKRKSAAALDEARLRQQAIGVKLRQMFDEVVNEPVPDEFLAILRKAEPPAGGE
jgi:hypothetical protein